MPGILWDSFRQGNRTEYLANYFLSALGVSAPVPRQEDIGIDFFCSVAQKQGNRLVFGTPYSVQVGSADTKTFSYGGTDKSEKWKEAELQWLYSQEIPLFFCVVDKSAASFKLYSPSALWPCRYFFGDLGEVVFIPDAVDDDLLNNAEVPDQLLPEGCGNRKMYKISLGKPVVHLTIQSLEDAELQNNARQSLTIAIQVEQENLRYRSLGLHFAAFLPLEHEANRINSTRGVRHFHAWNSGPGLHTDAQLEKMLPFCIALALNFKSQARPNELLKLKDTFSLYRPEQVPQFMREDIPELFDTGYKPLPPQITSP
jgi:hypothetical protein